MDRPRRNSNFQNTKKVIRSQKGTGKKNPKSKKFQNLIDQTNFAEDNLYQKNEFKANLNIDRGQVNIKKNFELTPLQKVQSQKDKTQRKPPLNLSSQPNEGNTVIRKKKLKSIGPKSKRNEYIYIIDPQSQKMKKYVVHQGEDINLLLNNKSEYIPPFMSCDEDCDSTQEIVQKGVEYSKKDLINEVERRKNVMSLAIFKERESQKSSSTDSRSIGK